LAHELNREPTIRELSDAVKDFSMALKRLQTLPTKTMLKSKNASPIDAFIRQRFKH
jgi:hypothetical protein